MAKPQKDRSLKGRIKGALRLKQAVALVWKCAPKLTVANICLMWVQGLLPLAQLYLMKLIVDGVTAGFTGPDKQAAFQSVGLYIVLTAVLALAMVGLRSIATLVSEAQSFYVSDYVSDYLHERSVAADLEHYENPTYYDMMHRAQQEAMSRPLKIVNGLAGLGQSAVSLIAIGGLLASLHWAVAIVAIVAAAPGVAVRLRYSGKMYEWQRQKTQTERRSWYHHWMLTDGSYAKEVRLFSLGQRLRDRFREIRRQLRFERLRLMKSQLRADLFVQGATSIAIYATYGFIAARTITGTITLGDLVMYFQAFQRGLGALQGVLGSLAGLYEDNLFLTNLQEYTNLQPRVVDNPSPIPVPGPIRQGFAVEHASFKYSAGSKLALDDVSLELAAGEVLVLVGENGSGKTTLAKLLCRLYDPTAGRITLDGRDLRDYRVADLRRNIAVIFQDFARYQLSARENIWLGNHDLPLVDRRIEDAAQESGAASVIAGLPRGFDSVLGNWFEDGRDLSLGEWQKVALARAFLREAQIVVLDEPTSALDPMAEHQIVETLGRLIAGRTAVIISHRLSAVRLAHRIAVLEGGRLIEHGTPTDLLASGGRYAHMMHLQRSALEPQHPAHLAADT
ncbi:MAG: ABC transporter ATP-binding protein [Thermoanaerobaculaceae bacterium]